MYFSDITLVNIGDGYNIRIMDISARNHATVFLRVEVRPDITNTLLPRVIMPAINVCICSLEGFHTYRMPQSLRSAASSTYAPAKESVSYFTLLSNERCR